MAQPYGFNSPQHPQQEHPQHVYKLHKALYGLKQALQSSYYTLRDYLLEYGFSNAKFDTSVFTYVSVFSGPC
ncbi:hypothetical protein CR513_47435, partial [Mucuna pruriens]